MSQQPNFNIATAHSYFAAHCFNTAWELMDKVERTVAENRLMEATSQASLYHWLQRNDCNSQNLSVSYWQLSRIYSLLGNASEALRYAIICSENSAALTPFYVAYAHEALARAHLISGNDSVYLHHWNLAQQFAEQVHNQDERQLIMTDLEQLKS